MPRFVPSPTVRAQILRSLELERAMAELADEALNFARAHVPVDTGALRDSLHTERASEGGRRVVAGTDHWLFPEFGTSDMEPQPYLRPSLDHLGLRRTQ